MLRFGQRLGLDGPTCEEPDQILEVLKMDSLVHKAGK